MGFTTFEEASAEALAMVTPDEHGRIDPMAAILGGVSVMLAEDRKATRGEYFADRPYHVVWGRGDGTIFAGGCRRPARAVAFFPAADQ